MVGVRATEVDWGAPGAPWHPHRTAAGWKGFKEDTDAYSGGDGKKHRLILFINIFSRVHATQ